MDANPPSRATYRDEATDKGYLSFDPVANEYDASRFLPPEVQQRAALLLQELAGLSAGDTLLDAGVGTGRFALPLAQQGVRVLGVDISLAMLGQLQAKRAALSRPDGALSLAQGDLRALPVKSASVRAVLFVHILHLIADWQRVLDEALRVLKPGGTLLLAREGGHRSATREFYFRRARELGVLKASMGADKEQVLTYLQTRGMEPMPVDETVTWKRHIPVRVTLQQLAARTWSSLWEVPDDINARLMQEAEAWVLQTYGTLDTDEEVEATLPIHVARTSGA